MIQKIKNQNISFKAFTLIELVIVLVIIWIMLMATVYLSGEQIQKVRDKTVKESILAEMQSRYSRNLWSSSYASWKIYDTMEITMENNAKKIGFKYLNGEDEVQTGIFVDKFEIIDIIKNWDDNSTNPNKIESITLKYTPYNISCMIWDDETNTNVVIITRVNDSRDYCFNIHQKNCRLIEISESKCKNLQDFLKIE